MEISTLELEAERHRVLSGDFEAATFEIFPYGTFSHLAFFGETNPLGYHNSQVAELLNRAAATMDPVEIDRIYRQLWVCLPAGRTPNVSLPGCIHHSCQSSGPGVKQPLPRRAGLVHGGSVVGGSEPTMNVQKIAWLRSIDRRRFMELCAGSVALAAVGCGRDRAPAESSTMTVLYPIDERGLGPAWDMPSQFLVFLPLVARNANGEFEGRLAEGWEHSPDYRTWTVHLRRGLRWHDGVPVTAHDVKFTLDLLAHQLQWLSPDAYSVRVLDDSAYTITYHRRAHIGSPLDDYAVYYPKHVLEKLDANNFANWDFWTHPVGNGPYRHVRHVPKIMMELEANPDYYRGKPRIERVVLKFGPPSIAELTSGNVDAITYVNNKDLLKLAGDSPFRSYWYVDSSRLNAIVWNHHNALFRDAGIRRALTLAINRRELLRVLNLPQQTPVFDSFFTDDQLRRGDLPQPLGYNPEGAQRLLEQAGWRETHANGPRQRNGISFRFTLLASPQQQWQTGTEEASIYVQAQLRRIGVEVEIQTMDFRVVRQRIEANKFDAAILPLSPADFLRLAVEIGYSNPQMAALFRQAEATMDPSAESRVCRELAPIFERDVPVTFISPARWWSTVARRRVHGLSSPYRAEPVWYMEDLWLEDRTD